MDQNNKTHPLVIAASVAVLASSVIAAAVLTGVFPSAASRSSDSPSFGSQAPQAQAPRAQAPQVPHSARPATRPAATRAVACTTCGVVDSIQAVEVKGEASGIGAVAGGVTGAVVGNQFGNGGGRAAMTLLGAAGGAYAGNAIEKNVKKGTAWRVAVRMDDGTVRTVSQSSQPPLAVGDHVRVVNGAIERI